MIEALKFVQGSIDKKGIVEELLHYRIVDGFVRGYNGRVSLCSPIETDLDITPKGLPFMKALAASTGTIALSVTAANRVAVKSGAFRAYIPQTENPFPTVEPEGELFPVPDLDLVGILKTLLPFTAEDASRPWAAGILFFENHAYATNNILLVEHDLGVSFPGFINIPKQTAREMVRLRENPTHIQLSDTSITFHYEGDRWLRSNAISCAWPNVQAMLASYDWSDLPVVPAEFFNVLNTLRPFMDDMSRVFIETGRLSTDAVDTEGASVDIDMFDTTGCFNIEQLLRLDGCVTNLDLSLYPKPCPFLGDSMRGIVIGLRT